MRVPFLDLVRSRVVVLDGAMGSALQQIPLDLQKDWMGHENISEVLNFTRPDVIEKIHESFLEVGCDAVETNTFGANKIVMAEADMADRVFENNKLAAEIARRACQKYETPDAPKYVIGSIGPGTKLVSLQQTTWDVMEDSYFEQIRGLIAGGVDALLIETAQDLLQIKCAIAAANRAMEQAGVRVPIMTQMSMDLNAGQSMLMGSDSETVVATLNAYDEIDVLGLNCATGPTELTEHVAYFSKHWPRFISVLPNAGLPVMVDGQSHFPLGPDDFARGMLRFVEEYKVNIVGGCCGTTPAHLKALIDALREKGYLRSEISNLKSEISDLKSQISDPKSAIRNPQSAIRSITPVRQVSSLIQVQDIRQDLSYLVIAERTNTNGSRQFKRLLQAEDWDGLVSMARDEVRDGAHMLDVCVDFVGRDGKRDMHEVLSRYVRQIPVPLMIDSTDPEVMEVALKLAGGRCALNSMNLEEGEEKLARICRLARKYGAAVVAGTIDEDKENAMARTAERKLAIARRIRDLAVDKYGLHDHDLMFDPLVLPISTGIEEDRRNALETIEGTRLITKELPDCYTVVGLSNISFGLAPPARVVLNSAFLHELREAGLTGAIVHASKILPRNKIDDEKWNAALDLIYDRRREGFDPLTHFISLFEDAEDAGAAAVDPWEGLSLEEKLKKHIIDGEKRQLTEHLDEAMAQGIRPLDIINNILLAGMKVVGDLFGRGEMQLPFVLQSAETMKAAVAHLEPHMEKVEGQTRGRIVLATVKGDVHDIGKNLVDIILTNNGYTVFNLGIKQPIHEIVRAFQEKKADAIGMSGLLVKSVGVMKENLEELNAMGVKVPVLLGGAALTRDYAEDDLATLYQGSLLYCRDAFDGLKVMDHIAEGKLDVIIEEQRANTKRRKELRAKAVKPRSLDAADVKPVDRTNPVPTPPFWGRRVVKDIPAQHVFGYVNETALFTGQWGFKRKGLKPEEYERILEEKARPIYEDLKRRTIAEGIIKPMVVYGYFPVQASGNDLIVYHIEEFLDGDKVLMKPKAAPRERLRFSFPRQEGRRRLCISDFFRPVESGEYDVLGTQLVTVGTKATETTEQLRAENRYQDYLYLHGLSVESAEGLAEFWHKRMRQELGFGSEDAPEIRKLFQQGYRGSRYSFGYPACPELADRRKIVELLQPDEIGVQISENHMLIPEQSTDAIVVHHPQAKYFDVA